MLMLISKTCHKFLLIPLLNKLEGKKKTGHASLVRKRNRTMLLENFVCKGRKKMKRNQKSRWV